MESSIDLNGFISSVIKRSYDWIKLACDDLTEDQMHYQSTPDSNSIAWMVWHSSRIKDQVTASIVGESEVWLADGWAERFGIAPEANGIGDRPEQVTSFRVRSDFLLGYADAAHNVTIQRLSKILPAQLAQPSRYVLGDTRPVWRSLQGMLGDAYSHAAQVSYLRGMITGYGWRDT